jgi:hypothetical protein
MTPPEIDRMIANAAEQAGGVDRAALDRVTHALTNSLRPVQPIAPAWLQIASLAAMPGAIALLGAGLLGFLGLHRLSATQAAVIFPTLGGAAWLASAATVAAMIPGARRLVGPGLALGGGVAAILAVFALVFHDYTAGRFVPDGMICLKAGMLFAVPAGLMAALILRRGYAVNRTAAGTAAGTLAGLAGLTLLELHCPNLRAPHVMLWHVAPVPLAALCGWLIYSLGWKRKAAELMQ